MHGRVLGNSDVVATELQGRYMPDSDKIVRPQNWVWFARFLWPTKTAAHLASVAGKDERTAKRWLAGEFEPPGVVYSLLIAKLFERE